MKTRFLVVLTIIAMVSVMPMSGIYGQRAPEAAQGNLTSDIAWGIENNTLYISGKGVVPTTMLGKKSAWFNYIKDINSVIIEEGVTGIGQNVFTRTKNLKSVTIAGTVKDISPNAFNSCKLLSTVEVKGATPPDFSISVFYKAKLEKAKLIIPAGTRAEYEADALWSMFGNIEESAKPAEMQTAPVESLSEPCTINLTRTTNFVGGGVGVQVFINGEDMGKLGNGSTITIQTDRDKNVLYIKQGKRPISIRRIDAVAGGNINVEFSYFLGYMKIIEENE